MKQLAKRLLSEFPEAQVLLDEPMSRHTTMRVGGPADILFLPQSAAQVQRAIALANARGVQSLLIGNGSNLIVRDGGLRALVIALGEGFSQVSTDGQRVTAQAGAMLSQVGAEALRNGLSGFEFAAGIPGTVGGGVAMNAGAYGGELRDVLREATVLENGEIRIYSLRDFDYGYRTSAVLRKGAVVLEAVFELSPGDPEAIAAQMSRLAAMRRDKQPLAYPSAGSVFKRPEGHFAGALIEQAGLKGLLVGGAQVSEKHAGFIVNLGDAASSDVISLIEQVQAEVLNRFGIALECEVRILGEA